MAVSRKRKAPTPQPTPDLGIVAPKRRLFTVHEYHQMGDAGILGEDDRVELINGEIVEMPPIGENHFGEVNRFTAMFSQYFAGQAVVHIQNPLRLGQRIEPQPDVVLLRFRDDFYKGKFPGPEDALLVVEVAESSLTYDRQTKVQLYAQAGIVEYWIVNLVDGEIEVYRDPAGTRYRSMQTLKSGDTVSPVEFPDVTIPVAELLG
ncbi:MAG: Uma2 family endonuclease [Chloroflexota bacterium]